MTITQDWQAEIGGLTIGRGTDYPGIGAIDGIGLPPIRSNDEPSILGDGAQGGIDSYGVRTLTIPIRVLGTDDADCFSNLEALVEAFSVKRSGEKALDVRYPSNKTRRYYGRPSDVPAGGEGMKYGALSLEVEFRCLDPLAYGGATSVSAASAFNIENEGNVYSTRATLTLTSDGGGPMSITHGPTGQAITWESTLSNGTERVIDLHRGTITDSSGTNKASEVSVARFFALTEGTQQLTATNCTCEIEWRHAYLS